MPPAVNIRLVVILVWCICLFAFASDAASQSSAVSDCTQALYRADYERAEQSARQRLEKTPSDVTVRGLLGRAQLAQGKLSPALPTLVEAGTAASSNIHAPYRLAF